MAARNTRDKAAMALVGVTCVLSAIALPIAYINEPYDEDPIVLASGSIIAIAVAGIVAFGHRTKNN
ncbi:MAG: hypothetical protein LBM23_08865 [Propionibacteriaceae bacterium]|nr:hypothetical protein [Propionibacteriaceae bacterium]